jgi:hypothetical protein
MGVLGGWGIGVAHRIMHGTPLPRDAQASGIRAKRDPHGVYRAAERDIPGAAGIAKTP